MKTYLDCWIASASTLFAQALAGEPQLIEKEANVSDIAGLACRVEISGDIAGHFTVILDPRIVETPLLGDGVNQSAAWTELLREVAEAAAGELLATEGTKCRVLECLASDAGNGVTRALTLKSESDSWSILVRDELRTAERKAQLPSEQMPLEQHGADRQRQPSSSGLELLLDVELEAALRFGCCQMALGEILELGPGDVVELDRHITDPVDLIVSDKIVARGEVVLVNGNLGLRVTEVAEPQSRLESIRCLF